MNNAATCMYKYTIYRNYVDIVVPTPGVSYIIPITAIKCVNDLLSLCVIGGLHWPIVGPTGRPDDRPV